MNESRFSKIFYHLRINFFQLHPGYVVCSFVFLLLGLASLSSSINLLVLRFMILSLEEDEEEIYDLQDVTQNVITLGMVIYRSEKALKSIGKV